ncbi:hypothetical protein KUL42_18190 [Alteromonas sp. KUL42]|uniref:alginate lyase family protein n=1 Tax=Alteromonas sp. KUL42 TaxID=2480797 RepID=UPI0010368B15|nr:alginate lyase family protein [Alteromonas sp. KUL42]TAP35580.1 alginate lyase family protein [Alteromonas sp. KUL42]GEA07058.1 hypothetical protein KUL42_18190 [Alteromonas sp. KUL42]
MKLLKLKTILGLGIHNLVRFGLYRIGIRTGLNPVKRLKFKVPKGVFYEQPSVLKTAFEPCSTWQGSHHYFGREISSPQIPNWHLNCLNHLESPKNSPWFKIGDFDSTIGDIKGIWEASRFDWVLAFAQRAAVGDKTSLRNLNDWLNSWTETNPPYNGVNWKCGQEASIRVMHLACAALILNQIENTSQPLLDLIEAHLQRISPTILYAVAQSNNHATSEASALFIGGDWLARNGKPQGQKWREQGRKWLENRAASLIMRDGTFSQYSTNYHRVMLDAYSIAEIWRYKNNLPQFSNTLRSRLQAAINWLFELTDDEHGDVPNLGANDGARLLPLTNTDYRDFRPSVQLAATLFHRKAAWKVNGTYDLTLKWFGLEKPVEHLLKRPCVHHPDGGYFVLRSKSTSAFVLFNYPKYKFRPSQNDALHVDFWVAGENLLRDGGTFSYNAGQRYIDYYGGVKSHNTIEIDKFEPMPRLSRFLLGAWLKPFRIKDDTANGQASAGYQDYLGRSHYRSISLDDERLKVTDTLSGVKQKAILRWRLKPSNWKVIDTTITDGKHTIKVSTSATIKRFEITEGKESRYYFEETPIPVLEIELAENCTLTTEYKYN